MKDEKVFEPLNGILWEPEVVKERYDKTEETPAQEPARAQEDSKML